MSRTHHIAREPARGCITQTKAWRLYCEQMAERGHRVVFGEAPPESFFREQRFAALHTQQETETHGA